MSKLLTTKEGFVYCLKDEIAEEYDEICQSLVREQGWGAKFSEDYVELAIRKILGQVLKGGSTVNLNTCVDELIEEHEQYSTEHIVLNPMGVSLCKSKA